ncbi:MAG: tyrosine-type recombinase/integrase [Vicinamibacterales bacterium]
MGSIYRRTKKQTDGTVRELPTWWIKFYQDGRSVRESTGSTKEGAARRMLRSREGDVEHGVPIEPKMGRITFEDAAKDIINDYQINGRRSLGDAQRRIDLHLSPTFKGRRLLAITTSVVREYITARQAEGAANGTINRELAVLKRMFSLAVKDRKLHAKPHIPMLEEDNVRRGFFEPEQFRGVVSHLPAALQPVATFAHITGWRLKSEILPLQWRQVDWNNRVVRLDPGTTKNREGRSYPFTAALEALLTTQLDDHKRLKKAGKIVPHVFHRDGEPIKSMRGSWQAACVAAGQPGRIPHDFRRTAVRNLEHVGVSRSAAMAMVGHKTEAIYRRYAIVDAGALRDAAAKIDQAAGTLSGTLDQKRGKKRGA